MKIFKCNKCGNMVELIEDGKGVLTCCGDDMVEVVPNTEDAAVEKHVPYTSIEDDDVLYVKIGEADHPMTEEHYITWVAAVYNDSVLKYTFKPGEVPEAVFDYEEGMKVYAYCNLHGLWIKKL